jgi:hypothetical protein
MQHAIQYSLLAFIGANAVWQGYAAARWLTRRLWRPQWQPIASH